MTINEQIQELEAKMKYLKRINSYIPDIFLYKDRILMSLSIIPEHLEIHKEIVEEDKFIYFSCYKKFDFDYVYKVPYKTYIAQDQYNYYKILDEWKEVIKDLPENLSNTVLELVDKLKEYNRNIRTKPI